MRAARRFSRCLSAVRLLCCRWLARKENGADSIGGVNLDVADPYVKAGAARPVSDSHHQRQHEARRRCSTRSAASTPPAQRRGWSRPVSPSAKAPDIPSILVETAFISNPNEEKKLGRPEYQDQLASAILQGVRKYFAKEQPAAGPACTEVAVNRLDCGRAPRLAPERPSF